MSIKIVTPWHNKEQLQKFLDSWKIKSNDKRFIFQQDNNKEGCAVTKNKGIQNAVDSGAEIVIVLDDDCFPDYSVYGEWNSIPAIDRFIESHLKALEPVEVKLFKEVTKPFSRGTPYKNKTIKMPVACSVGFWRHIADYDACGQLVYGATNPMEFDRSPIFGQYFPLCGMNIAFKPKDWFPWYQFINVSRFDDIWMGWLWQKYAYSKGYCFNMNGPDIYHSRQSNVWANLRDEALYLEQNETIWSNIAQDSSLDYNTLLKHLPKK